MNKKVIYVEWFKSPAHLSRFVYLNKIKAKNIVSILIGKNNMHELWFYHKGYYRQCNKEQENE